MTMQIVGRRNSASSATGAMTKRSAMRVQGGNLVYFTNLTFSGKTFEVVLYDSR